MREASADSDCGTYPISPAHPHRLGGGVDAEDGDRPPVRLEQRGQHPDRGRLAGSVRAEQAERLAGLDHQVDPVHREVGAEAVAQSRAPDGGGAAGCRPGLGRAPRARSRQCQPFGQPQQGRHGLGQGPLVLGRQLGHRVLRQVSPQVAPVRYPPARLAGDC